MNAIKYGTKKGACVCVLFEWEWGRYIRVTIDDRGGKIVRTPEEIQQYVLQQIKNTNPTKRSGRGLAQIVSKWSDSFHISQSPCGGMRVSFEKLLGKCRKNMLYAQLLSRLPFSYFS